MMVPLLKHTEYFLEVKDTLNDKNPEQTNNKNPEQKSEMFVTLRHIQSEMESKQDRGINAPRNLDLGKILAVS